MDGQIILQGISIQQLLRLIEESFYKSQEKAIDDDKQLSVGINWSKYPDLMSIENLCALFPIEKNTARGWVRNSKFGDYVKDGKYVLVHKTSVRKYYEEKLKKQKR